ncbi:MAG: peptide chain release factor 2 [Eubacteriales bacterium]
MEQTIRDLEELIENIDDLAVSLRLEELEEEHSTLLAQTQETGFWDDPSRSQQILRRQKVLSDKINAYKELKSSAEDLAVLAEMADESGDESMVSDILAESERLQKEYDKQRIEVLLSGEYDASNAILSIHPGAGGTEAQDWAQMLYRMYTRWSEMRGFKYKILDYLDGDEAGIKSVTILIEGLNAYGYLKGETGVHRLVRVSPFDSSGRRHTSFASVEIMPEFNDEIKIEIQDEDLRVETHRASGAGGQKVNKTDSAVRMIHIPTGIVVGCQTERSQTQNKETCLKMLKSKLLEIKEREHLDKIEDIKGEKMNIEWGSQIRSYVFMPYTLVKDHRTSCEAGNINAVMDGEINDFINAYLKWKVK